MDAVPEVSWDCRHAIFHRARKFQNAYKYRHECTKQRRTHRRVRQVFSYFDSASDAWWLCVLTRKNAFTANWKYALVLVSHRFSELLILSRPRHRQQARPAATHRHTSSPKQPLAEAWDDWQGRDVDDNLRGVSDGVFDCFDGLIYFSRLLI